MLDLSIVIKVWNAPEYLKLNIESITKATQNLKYEIIIVDNASNKTTQNLLTALAAKNSRILISRQSQNTGGAHAAIIGFELAQSPFVAIMDSDVVVDNNWALPLLNHLSKQDLIAVTPLRINDRLRYPRTELSLRDYWLKIKKAPIGPEKKIDKFVNGLKFNEFASQIKIENRLTEDFVEFPHFASFSTIIVNKEKVKKINGIADPMFLNGGGEDVDFSWRALISNEKIQHCDEVYVHHFEHSSFVAGQISYSETITNNNELLYKKWGQIVLNEKSHLLSRYNRTIMLEKFPFIKLFEDRERYGTITSF